jgi:hypothetical protein
MTKSYSGLKFMTTFNPTQRAVEAKEKRAEAAARAVHGQTYMKVYDEVFDFLWGISPQNAEREAVMLAEAAAIKAYNVVFDALVSLSE